MVDINNSITPSPSTIKIDGVSSLNLAFISWQEENQCVLTLSLSIIFSTWSSHGQSPRSKDRSWCLVCPLYYWSHANFTWLLVLIKKKVPPLSQIMVTILKCVMINFLPLVTLLITTWTKPIIFMWVLSIFWDLLHHPTHWHNLLFIILFLKLMDINFFLCLSMVIQLFNPLSLTIKMNHPTRHLTMVSTWEIMGKLNNHGGPLGGSARVVIDHLIAKCVKK